MRQYEPGHPYPQGTPRRGQLRAFSPTASAWLSAGYDNKVKVWDAHTGQDTLTLKGDNPPVISVAFSPDGKRLLSGGWHKTVKVWTRTRAITPSPSRGTLNQVSSVAFSPDANACSAAVWTGR